MTRPDSYRPDIDGLRAIAVAGVVVFHLGIAAIPGGYVGVDVFFVISGFLISGILWREYAATGTIDFLNFWSRRLRRLLPMSILVVLASIAALYVSGNRLGFADNLSDAPYAILYATNWHEMNKGVDYFGEGNEASYFLHYWSLTVEEQYYAFLTVAFGIVVLAGKWRSSGAISARTLIAAVILVSILSFASCLYFTGRAQPLGFFGTQNRIWQFGMGVLAMAALRGSLKLPPVAMNVLAAIGLALIAFSYFGLPEGIVYPGAYALLPTIGAALTLFGCAPVSGMQGPVAKTLSVAPMRYIGNISYSLYLWHWGVILLAGERLADPVVFTGVVVTMFLLSVASYHLVENPLRYNAWAMRGSLRTIVVAAAVSGITVGAALPLQAVAQKAASIIRLPNGKAYNAKKIRADLPVIYSKKARCHTDQDEVKYPPCIFGDKKAKRDIVLLGDSHGAHWFPAVNEIAKQNGYRLLSRTKSACSPMDFPIFISTFKREYTECKTWRDAVFAEIATLDQPIVVIGSSSAYVPLEFSGKKGMSAEIGEARRAGVIATLDTLRQKASRVFVIRDTPWFKEEPLKCLPSRRDPLLCGTTKTKALAGGFPWTATASVDSTNVHLIDMNSVICPDDLCLPFGPEGMRFHDRHHLTATYSKSLAGPLFERMKPLLPQP